MLAKVVKSSLASGITPFSFPELGSPNPLSGNVSQFLVPDFSELRIIEPAIHADEAVKIEAIAEINPAPRIEEILQNARDEAARIIAEAEENASIIAQAAQEKAIQEIQARFDEEVSSKAGEVRLELTRTIEQVSSLAEEISARHEKDIVELALQIAKKVVGREVTIDREIAFTLVKVSLSKLHSRAVAEVHLNPEDFAFVQSHRERLEFRGALELIEDRSISVGGCLIHTETGDIDARIKSQFEEIAHGLLEG